MQVLVYNQLDTRTIPGWAKMKAFLEADDLRSAEVKKVGDNLYRARLDRSNRIVFSMHEYNGRRYAMVLEFIKQHAYDKSRFLRRGATVDEDKIPTLTALDGATPALPYINDANPTFHLLDKIISFDEAQRHIYAMQPPLIVIGSAGSGKTVLTLEKMKQAPGDILYVTRSPFLVHNARQLYYALDYDNEDQNIDFLSFQQYLESIRVPRGHELSFRDFATWFNRQRATAGLKDAHQLFEEFKGVITGPAIDAPYLSRDQYLGLGIKQSIFAAQERGKVYELFEKYLALLDEKVCWDSNIVSHQYLGLVEPRYDFIVVDEVQDLTTIQLQLILRSLHRPTDFILCGDSNQIVHPNFFSWSRIKTFFHAKAAHTAPADLVRILNTNYRNSPQITAIANRVLKLKNARFGSIDKESNYLVESNSREPGEAKLLADDSRLRGELDRKTRQSTHFAVIVMHAEQKAAARQAFGTPLIFSIQEAKGLEYDNVILYNFTSDDEARFAEIVRGVAPEDLEGELTYHRAKDKGDKSLEIYKFHINALYVAITRAVRNIYLIERNPGQRIFALLQIGLHAGDLDLESQKSSLDEWRQEARRLELQGKQEQAEEIRSQILKEKKVPWKVLDQAAVAELEIKAIEKGEKKARIAMLEYAVVHSDQVLLNRLIKVGFQAAERPDKALRLINKNHYMLYELKNPGGVLREADQYGVDFRNVFNQTPLMIATRLGNDPLVRELIERGADTEKVNNSGFNPLQIALEQAVKDPIYAARKLAPIYRLLETDGLDIQVDERLVKLDNRQMEFLMLNMMIAMFYTFLGGKNNWRPGAFEAGDFVDILAHFPASLLPERRKQRAYISSILSKNEVDGPHKYNRKLFLRVRTGHYVINPGLSVRIAGEWRRIYDILDLERIAHPFVGIVEYWGRSYDYNVHHAQAVKRLIDLIRKREISDVKAGQDTADC